MSSDKIKKTPARRQNRMAAVQFLYMWDANSLHSVERGLKLFFELKDNTREFYAFGEDLATGAIEHMDELDEVIQTNTPNWSFDRIAKTDLAILRLAIYELLYRRDIPPVVSVNEAIDLSKQLSSKDSKRFINGVLDKVIGTLDRPLRTAAED